LSRNAFDPLYTPSKVSGASARTEAMLTIAPFPRAPNALPAAIASRAAAVMFSAMIVSISAALFSSVPPFSDMPALLTNSVIAVSSIRRCSMQRHVVALGQVGGDHIDGDAISRRAASRRAPPSAHALRATRIRSCPRFGPGGRHRPRQGRSRRP
jgi:hypothetical protein